VSVFLNQGRAVRHLEVYAVSPPAALLLYEKGGIARVGKNSARRLLFGRIWLTTCFSMILD
jgi:hypothetical protein